MHIIRILRDYMGMTQKKLAARAGITASDLSDMESGNIYGRVDKYQRVAGCLGVPVHLLVADEVLSVPMSFFEKNERAPYKPVLSYKNLANGRGGEDFVLEKERERVSAFNPVLANLVLPYYKMGKTLGYDILSFNEDGQEVYIEVKTTHADRKNMVLLTQKEQDKAEKLLSQDKIYQVHCLNNWKKANQTYTVYDYKDLRANAKMVPTEYMFLLASKAKVSGMEYYRLKSGMSQLELGDLLGLNQSQVSLYENRERSCPIETLFKMAQIFNTTVDELLLDFDAAEIS